MGEALKLEKKRDVSVDPARMQLAEYQRQEWVCNVPPEITREDVLNPAFWSHMASLMKPYDHIEVRQEDGSWLSQLIVLQSDRLWAKVFEMRFVEFKTEALKIEAPTKHKVEWKGPQHKWAVIRLSDSEMLKSGMEKDEAFRWMNEHERTVG